jgi:hypothetical protein
VGKRENKVLVSLDAQELARLDEVRGDESRAVYMRRLLHKPPRDEMPTHSEAVLILARLARDNKVVAAVALEKALRDLEHAPEGELARLLRDE